MPNYKVYGAYKNSGHYPPEPGYLTTVTAKNKREALGMILREANFKFCTVLLDTIFVVRVR